MKDKLKQILESVDPNGEIFNESAQDKFVNLIEAKINEKVEIALAESAEEHTAKLNEALEAQDAEYAGKLETVLEHIDTDHAEKLEKVLEHIDTDHAEKLEAVLEHIDADHSEKLESVLESIDTDHSEKLQQIVDLYEAKLAEAKADKEDEDEEDKDDVIEEEDKDKDEDEDSEEVKIDEKLAENVSEYLENFINESTDTVNFINEARLEKLEGIISEMRKTLSVTDEYVETEITEAVLDAKSQIETANTELNKSLNESIELKKQIKTLEAKQLLESKTSAFSESKKLYISKVFAESTKEDILSNIDEAVKAYDTELNEKRQMIKEAKMKQVTDYYAEAEPVLKEQTSANPEMDAYVNNINKSYGS